MKKIEFHHDEDHNEEHNNATKVSDELELTEEFENQIKHFSNLIDTLLLFSCFKEKQNKGINNLKYTSSIFVIFTMQL